jgi:rhodanese-related sulfurtransferase
MTYIKDGIPTITPQDVQGFKGALLIDVRTPEEYVGELGHIAGSSLKTLGTELDQFLSSADKNQAIIFICRSGMRSGSATAAAMTLGIKNVYNMEGGMLAWNSLSLPTEK